MSEATQETEPEHAQNSPGKVDRQIPQIQMEEANSINDKLCEAQGIEVIPWQQNEAEQVPLPLEVPETYKEAARRLGLFKPTTTSVAKLKESHKKGIKPLINGTSNALTTLECQPKPLPGLGYLEDLEDEDPTMEPERMIVENHDVKLGQEAQSTLKSVQTMQRGVKHDLSDPHAREDEHLDPEVGQGPEHMVVADHGPKKGMAPRLKPQFNPLFFPFATCLPNISMPQDHDLKAGHNTTRKARSQASLMGGESNDNQDKLEQSLQGSSTIDTMSTKSVLTSPWPDQWQPEQLDNDIMTDLEDPWPELKGTNAWNDTSNESDSINNDPYVTPWGLFGEP